MNNWLIYGIGFTAQALFTARMLVQWIASERARKVLSPTIYWQLSLFASLLLCLYGALRNDFAIILGQFVSYYIYIWNLNAKKSWNRIPPPMRLLFIAVPIALATYFILNWNDTVQHLFTQDNIPPWLIVFGVTAQFAFTLRFIYQWWYSRGKGESVLPTMFWIISLTGSFLIACYGLIRRDPVLIIGQSGGFIVYIRNLMLIYRRKKNE